jgi:SOS regulatory protein LexA
MEKDAHYREQLGTFFAKHKRMPSVRELMTLTGLRSSASAAKLIERLIRKGVIAKDETGRILPRTLNKPRILGTVAAGFPIPAEEERGDVISLDTYLIDHPEATYLLTITGDSMTGAGIMPGDIVIVDRSQTPVPGNIVIAELDSEWTVKYLRKDAQGFYLEAAHPHYPILRADSELKIAAVVTGIIRKY